MQDQHSTQKNLPTPLLEIKPPAIEVNREKIPPGVVEASTENNSVIDGEGDEDEDEEDWDTFQSFPASTREAITDNVAESCESEGSEVFESNSPSVSMEDSPPLPTDALKVENMEHGETSEEVTMSISPTDQRSSDGDATSDRSEMHGVSDHKSENVDIVPNQEQDTENEAMPG